MQILTKIMTFELLNLLVCQASTSFREMWLSTCSLSHDNFIRKIGDSVAFRTFGVLNVDKGMRNYVCSGKRNFHVSQFFVFTVTQ